MQCFLAKPTIALLNHEASRSSMDFITNHFRHTTEIMQWSNSSALYKAAHDGYNIVLWCQKKHKKQQPIVIIKSFLYVFLAQRCEVLVHIQYSTCSCYLGQRDKLPVLWTSDHPKLINCMTVKFWSMLHRDVKASWVLKKLMEKFPLILITSPVNLHFQILDRILDFTVTFVRQVSYTEVRKVWQGLYNCLSCSGKSEVGFVDLL